ncbi:MAG: hypothetical protein J6R83_00090, partial [Clostridia bacterium]|nr:hypothetical protein [Clostridia bacterium]
TEDATSEEIDQAYKKLKEKYSRERFYEGEIGNDAAKNLTKLENAYAEIVLERNSNKGNKEETMNYSEVEGLIKEGRISEAQNKLDEFSERDAEWHYLQAVIFYKKNWNNESKKQLEIAMNMDPFNSKYSDSYQKLKQKTEFNQQNFYQQQPNQNYNNRQMGCTNDCMTMCATWCCIDMMFQICCGCR